MSSSKPTKKALHQHAKSLGLKGHTTLGYDALYDAVEQEESRLRKAHEATARQRAFSQEVQERGYKELMVIINHLRQTFLDANPVEHLDKGIPRVAHRCPVSMTLTQGAALTCVEVIVLPSLIRLVDKSQGWIVDWPVEGFAYYFLRGLEAGKYPEFSV